MYTGVPGSEDGTQRSRGERRERLHRIRNHVSHRSHYVSLISPASLPATPILVPVPRFANSLDSLPKAMLDGMKFIRETRSLVAALKHQRGRLPSANLEDRTLCLPYISARKGHSVAPGSCPIVSGALIVTDNGERHCS